jgi:cytochrome c551/c552
MSLKAHLKRTVNLWMACLLLLLCFAGVMVAQSAISQLPASDPGVRGGTIDAGQVLGSVASTPGLLDFASSGSVQFLEEEVVTGGDNNGLGPRFNNTSCGSCHSQPATGGTSPSQAIFPLVGPNPQFQTFGGQNTIPPFVTADGPVREARFKFFVNPDGTLSTTRDGGVHDLFVVTGRGDATGCSIDQPDFATNLTLGNVIFRIPTPVFGAGLIENIDDATILANMNANADRKSALLITGHPNRNGNDGTIARFGWKAQNKSLELFAGEAYNVEMGVSNELFPTERPSPGEAGFLPGCLFNPTPEDTTHFVPGTPNAQVPSDVTQFAVFMRTLAPPTPSTTNPGGAASIANGGQIFANVGCSLCHTPTMRTAASSVTADLSQVNANLFSDLLVHQMGTKLADGVRQGNAGVDEFRTAPLWGLGQRIFFLHDGRTSDLLTAIRQHDSPGSEASGVIAQFRALTESQKQDLLNFLRSL